MSEGMSFTEIGRALGISKQAAWITYAKAIAKIRMHFSIERREKFSPPEITRTLDHKNPERILERVQVHMRCEAFLAEKRGDHKWAESFRSLEPKLERKLR